MDQVLLLSLLSMDSYNQRYGFNLNDVNNKNGIGNIRIGADSVAVLGQKSQETGFYAIEYQVDGKSIIAYRGTNPEFSTNTVGQFLASPLVKDIWDGWTLGAGFTAATQGAQAIRFYEAVAQRSVYNPVGNGTQILLTGHSLGGGLAGFVGALSKTSASGFDHMPFGLAAWGQALSEAIRRATVDLKLTAYSNSALINGLETGTLPEILSGAVTLAAFARAVSDNLSAGLAPYAGALTGYFLEGEALQYLRDGSTPLTVGGVGGLVLSLLGAPILGQALASIGVGLAYSTTQLESQVDKTGYSLYGSDLSAVDKHSIALDLPPSE